MEVELFIQPLEELERETPFGPTITRDLQSL